MSDSLARTLLAGSQKCRVRVLLPCSDKGSLGRAPSAASRAASAGPRGTGPRGGSRAGSPRPRLGRGRLGPGGGTQAPLSGAWGGGAAADSRRSAGGRPAGTGMRRRRRERFPGRGAASRREGEPRSSRSAGWGFGRAAACVRARCPRCSCEAVRSLSPPELKSLSTTIDLTARNGKEP